MVQGLVRLTLLAVLVLSGCAVTPPAEKTEPVTADTELRGSPAMALLRLEEGDGHAAEGFAQRALRLAPDNDDYRAELWELVAAARAEQGDRSGADEARARAQALRQPDRA